MSNSRELSQLADLITIDDNTRNIGFSTLTNIGIGTSSPNHKLNVGGNANITGIISASTFVGSASGLTNVPAESIVGTLPQLDGSNLINLIGLGSGINIRSSDSILGIASVINFGNNIDVTFSSGVSTISINSIGYATSSGIATYASNAGIATYATSAGIATYATNAGIATYATNAGIATYATNAGIATYATNAGIATYATNAGIATYATNAGIATYATYATNAGIATSVIGGITSVTSLSVSGVSTVGVLTASSIGIGTTNPTSKLHVVGNTLVTGILTSSSFSGNGANLTGIVTSIVAGTNITISGSTGQVTVNSTANTNTTINDNTSSSSPLYLTAVSNTSGTVQSLSVSSTRLSFIPSTGTLSATTFSGALTGTASNVTTNANLTGDVTSTGNATSIAANVIVDADINTSAGIVDTKLATISTAGKVSNSATTATNADTPFAIVARDVSGNFSAGIITATSFSGSGANLTNLNATNLTSGKIPDGRFPDTLPAASGENLTNLNAANLTNLNAANLASGTIPDGRFPDTLPAISGANLTNLNPSNLTSGTITATSFVKTGGTSSQFLKADGTVDNSLYIALTSNYTQNGASTPRSIQSKLNDIVSVKDFGAVGDGITNDWQAFQDAFNYASGKQVGIYVPGGRFLIKSTLTLNVTGSTSNVIYGDGNGVTVLMMNTGGNGINVNYTGNYWLLDVSPGSTACAFRNLTFTTTNTFQGKCLAFEGVSKNGRPTRQTVIENVEFQGYQSFETGWATQVSLHNISGVQFDKCRFTMGPWQQGDGVHWWGDTSDNSPTTIHLNSCVFTYGNRGFYISDSYTEGVYMTSCEWVACNYGVYVDINGGESGVHIIGGHSNCLKRCFYIKGMIGGTISNVLTYATGHNATERYAAIELLNNTAEFTIIGNQFAGGLPDGTSATGYQDCGIYLGSQSSLAFTNYITGNIFENWFSQSGSAIYISPDCQRVNIGPNAFNNCVSTIVNGAAALPYSVSVAPTTWSTVVTKNLVGGASSTTVDITIPANIFSATSVPNAGDIQSHTYQFASHIDPAGTSAYNARFYLRSMDGSNIPQGTYTFYCNISRIFTTYG